nr:MAG TPA: hypothetical protein [Caudoviricetes sp.]
MHHYTNGDIKELFLTIGVLKPTPMPIYLTLLALC